MLGDEVEGLPGVQCKVWQGWSVISGRGCIVRSGKGWGVRSSRE